MTADEIVQRLNGRWTGDQALARCPVKGHGKGRGDLCPSLSISVGRNGRVLLHCFAGCRAEDIFAASLSASPPYASCLDPAIAIAPPQRGTGPAAQALWNTARPVNGTAGEAYLHLRGLKAKSDALRFLPAARHPNAKGTGLTALLAAIHGPDNVLVALQRTFLTRAGAKADVNPARMMLGRLGSGAVRLAPTAATLGLAEGVETALAASQLHGLPCWATCGARLERIALPVPVRHVVLFADNDPPGLATADRAVRRFRAEGRDVEIRVPPSPGTDWADVIAASSNG
jgi:putative DNA primase/helicase